MKINLQFYLKVIGWILVVTGFFVGSGALMMIGSMMVIGSYWLRWNDEVSKGLWKGFWNVFFFLVMACFLTTFLTTLKQQPNRTAMRISCASNLKQIGLALKQYAIDNDGWFPPEDGEAGLQRLVAGDYMTDFSVYHCPSDPAKCGTRDNWYSSYTYRGGCRNPGSIPNSGQIPVCFDSGNFHQNFGNILFDDGHVKGYTGKDFSFISGTDLKKETR